MTSSAQTVLKHLIHNDFRSTADFARACGVHQSLVWRDCNSRQMSDERLRAYLSAFQPESALRLLNARLNDLLPSEMRTWITVEQQSGRVKESFDEAPLLSEKGRTAVREIALKMADDPKFESWIIEAVEMSRSR
jgi:hypothetical protein